MTDPKPPISAEEFISLYAEEMFGTEPGKYLQFTFYTEKHIPPEQKDRERSPISPLEANRLLQHLLAWLRERGYGFDGGAYLGNEWKGGRLQKVGVKKEAQDEDDPDPRKL